MCNIILSANLTIRLVYNSITHSAGIHNVTKQPFEVDVGYERFLGPEIFFHPEVFIRHPCQYLPHVSISPTHVNICHPCLYLPPMSISATHVNICHPCQYLTSMSISDTHVNSEVEFRYIFIYLNYN